MPRSLRLFCLVSMSSGNERGERGFFRGRFDQKLEWPTLATRAREGCARVVFFVPALRTEDGMPKENDLEGQQDQGGKHGGQAGAPKPTPRPAETDRDKDTVKPPRDKR